MVKIIKLICYGGKEVDVSKLNSNTVAELVKDLDSRDPAKVLKKYGVN